jgi:membrane protease subunit (stomatin/prohibitin family)
MGLIKAAVGSIKGTFADQWKEYFYCESMEDTVLMTKGQKVVTRKFGSNRHGNDNIISNGSGIAVNEGQCAIVVEDGKILDLAADPGRYTFDKGTEPSIFAESFGKGLVDMFRTMWGRLGYGGDTGKDQRVYYFNLKELLDNKFGTPNPVPFRVVDTKIALDIDVSVRCFGTFSYKISNPILFYTNVAGNVEEDFTRDRLDGQLKSEFISALQPAFGELSAKEIRPNQLVAHIEDMKAAMNDALKELWADKRGLEVVSIAINSVTLPKEDEDLIKNLQRQAVYKNAGMAGATLVEAQAEAMKNAASNPNGAVMGFYGLNMANQAGGMNANNFFAMQAQQDAAAQQKAEEEKKAAVAAGAWTCPKCGEQVTGNFCPNCGEKKPVDDTWTCPKCGEQVKGRFCSNCGTPKPEAIAKYKCSKCGYEPEDPAHPGKFCPNCGKPFGPEDIVR